MSDLWLLIIICIIILALSGIAVCYCMIKWTAGSCLYNDIDKLPFGETALILGTAKFTQKGGINHFFKYRMDAAQLIFEKNKASHFIVSGAGKRHVSTSEAEDMKMSLAMRGLPEEIIIVDEAGYRTWDSLWRCLHTFHCNQVTVISQRFHIERAIFIGRSQGMHITGFCAKAVKGKIAYKMFLRECLARVKCIIDCYIVHPKPLFIKRREI
ncbi:MAG: vancomycin high temperature exclusion protein [Chitinophagaceae bacterium]|nr:MAG: vancomycin high temperature exclusion protein [Chitinophagaceae bacterium]